MIKLTLPDDIVRTPEVEAWLAEMERILSAEAERMLLDLFLFGRAPQ